MAFPLFKGVAGNEKIARLLEKEQWGNLSAPFRFWVGFSHSIKTKNLKFQGWL
jgi:hypothetical protein